METPQLSDISSFNPDDPQVRQIDIDSSSLSSSANDKISNEHQSNMIQDEKEHKFINVKEGFPLAETDEEMSSEMSVADEVNDTSNNQANNLVASTNISQLLQKDTSGISSNAAWIKKQSESSFVEPAPPMFNNNYRFSSLVMSGGDE